MKQYVELPESRDKRPYVMELDPCVMEMMYSRGTKSEDVMYSAARDAYIKYTAKRKVGTLSRFP